jgi:hypothetical protein
VRAAVWCLLQFFARSTPRVNNASSSSDNEHRKKIFFPSLCPALSYILHIAQRARSQYKQQNSAENQTHVNANLAIGGP